MDPLRYDKNAITQVPGLNYNIYTGSITEIQRFESRQPPLKQKCWSYSDLRTYLEKFFIYMRDFPRIAEFLPFKQCKDCIDLFYMIKKACKLSDVEN